MTNSVPSEGEKPLMNNNMAHTYQTEQTWWMPQKRGSNERTAASGPRASRATST